LDFRKHGDSSASSKSLKAALKENRHVSTYLLGRKKMPGSLPPHYNFGGEDEAVIYADDNEAAWKATPGALELLSEHSD